MRVIVPRSAWAVLTALVAACSRNPPQREALLRIQAIHGEAGPWAVAGYRMGDYALRTLHLPRHSVDLEVVHRSPPMVQFSCIVDGASAATGASLGKLNLRWESVDPKKLETVYRNKKTQETLVLRPTASFVERFKDLPQKETADFGRVTMALPDEEIFSVGANKPAP